MSNDEFVDKLKIINPNIQPIEEFVSTKDTIRCRCLLCGTEWSPFSNNLLQGSGCPKCAHEKSSTGRHITAVEKNNFAVNYPNIAAEWDYSKNGNKKPEDYSSGSDAVVWWICPVGHHYPAKINDRTQNRHRNGCSQCNYRYHTSFPEQALYYSIAVFKDGIKISKTNLSLDL